MVERTSQQFTTERLPGLGDDQFLPAGFQKLSVLNARGAYLLTGPATKTTIDMYSK